MNTEKKPPHRLGKPAHPNQRMGRPAIGRGVMKRVHNRDYPLWAVSYHLRKTDKTAFEELNKLVGKFAEEHGLELDKFQSPTEPTNQTKMD